MSTDPLYYLRPNVLLEPLIDSWYAWSHLIFPPTAARNLTERHLKIMDSYIRAPQLHAAAVKNPEMLGGPFIDYDGHRCEEIRDLRQRTVCKRADLIELSSAIAQLDDILRNQAKGASLEPLYSATPDALRGYVELTYDLNHHPSYRFIEPLLYKSRYNSRFGQSLQLSLITNDERPFALSTPRLPASNRVELQLPFSSRAVDDLFRLKHSPRCWGEIRELFALTCDQQELFRTFLTGNPPPAYHPYDGNGVRWRYFGHACVLVETAAISILFDPVISYTYPNGIPRYYYQDLPETVDFIVITHGHQDHVLLETLLQLRHKTKTIIVPRATGGYLQDPSLSLILRDAGFMNVVELGEFEEIQLPNGSLVGIPFLGEHADLAIRTKLAYMLRLGTHSIMFAADSCNIEPRLYDLVHDWVHDVDVLFLGMECDGAPLTWLYGPLLTRPIDRALDHSRRLSGSNYDQALSMVEKLGCKEVYVYAMGQEPWLNYIMSIKYTDQSRPIVDSNRLIETCRSRGLTAERLFGEKDICLA